ncbi:MAG: sulfur relay protein DsrC [Deltaproteobacteria bacterium]|nr:sulfur relay protein DsrC [Deltaproteobacteria bacterium]
MLWLSEILIQNPEMKDFEELKAEIKKRAAAGELFFRMDVKPQFTDTPADWEEKLEATFTSKW